MIMFSKIAVAFPNYGVKIDNCDIEIVNYSLYII